MATCKGCGAPIVWIRTGAGKSMPCDPEPVVFEKKAGGKGKYVIDSGEVVSGEPVKGTGSCVGYVPHWATCPASQKFKKS